MKREWNKRYQGIFGEEVEELGANKYSCRYLINSVTIAGKDVREKYICRADVKKVRTVMEHIFQNMDIKITFFGSDLAAKIGKTCRNK